MTLEPLLLEIGLFGLHLDNSASSNSPVEVLSE